MRPVISALILLLTLAILPAGAQAPNPDSPAAAGVQAADGPAVDAAPALSASGLPERAPQARSLRAYWHVFIAFAVTWILLFGYALSVGRRFARLEESVRRLRVSAD